LRIASALNNISSSYISYIVNIRNKRLVTLERKTENIPVPIENGADNTIAAGTVLVGVGTQEGEWKIPPVADGLSAVSGIIISCKGADPSIGNILKITSPTVATWGSISTDSLPVSIQGLSAISPPATDYLIYAPSVAAIFEIPFDFDSSMIPNIKLRWFTDTASTTVSWSVVYGYVEDYTKTAGDLSSISSTGNTTNTTVNTVTKSVTSPAAINKMTATTFDITGLNMISSTSSIDSDSDLMFIKIIKNTGPSNTYGVCASFNYRQWCEGQFE